MNRLLLAVLTVGLPAPLVAAAPLNDAPGKTFAVVVGIDRYADEQIKPRRHAETDARALVELLTNKDYGLGTPVEVRLLLGSRAEQKADKASIVKALQDVVGQAAADDVVFFVFLGQGAPVGNQLGLFAADSTFRDRAANALTSTDIEQALARLQSRRFVALLDVNFADFDAGTEKIGAANLASLFRTFLGREDRPDQPIPAGRIVALASRSRQPSLDLDQHGVFMHAVLEGLRGAADNAGYEPDGIVTAEELLTHVARRIPELARADGTTNEAKQQVPLLLGSRVNLFALTRNPPAAAQVTPRLERFVSLVQKHGLAEDLDREGRELLQHMPALPGDQGLRKVYQQLADGKLLAPAFGRARVQALADRQQLHTDADAYAQRVMQAARFIQGRYVRSLSDSDLIAWAGDGLCRRAGDARVLTAVQERFDHCRQLPEAEMRQLLADVRERLGRRNDLANRRDVELSVLGITSHLDPYSGYVEAQRVAEFKRLVSGTHTGIGVRIAKEAKSDLVQVVTPIKDGPAYKAGLRGGDVITRIVRETDAQGRKLDKPDEASTKGMALADATARLLGNPGTLVKLMVERPGKAEPFAVTVPRGVVVEETVCGVRRRDNDEWDYWVDQASGIAYFRLTQFQRRTGADLRKALRGLDGQGVKGVVLDLRFNPGGLLQTAIEVSRLFVDDGLIVTTRPRVGKEQIVHGDPAGHPYRNFPMAVLVNGLSASASEIVSACLQDHRRAVVVGERSYGKGSVQNYMDFPLAGGVLRLTIASFWRPSGKNLHRASTKGSEADDWGVRPNPGYVIALSGPEREAVVKHYRAVEVIPCREGQPMAEVKLTPDRQLDAAVEYLRRQVQAVSAAPRRKAG